MTWPNVLVLDYLQQTGQSNPELELQARSFINEGYQRLLTFEHTGGGFSWHGHDAIQLVLTAYGLMEMSDMSRVHAVDPAVIQRNQAYLASTQLPDGSWESPQDRPFHTAGSINNDALRSTAFITWALLESGDTGSAATQGLAYVRANLGDATDAFTQALVAAALFTADPADPDGAALANDLAQSATQQDGAVVWDEQGAGLMYGYGSSVALETTALAALALMKGGQQLALAEGAITHLIRSKDALGNFGTTQATVLTLKAMLAALVLPSGSVETDAVITVSHNGQQVASVTITPQTSDVHRQVDLKEYIVSGNNTVELTMVGTGKLAYQVVGLHYVPWSLVPPPDPGPLTIQVAYDRTTLLVNEMITATVTVQNNLTTGSIPMVIADLGIPPGFEVITQDLDTAKDNGLLQNYELTDRQIIAYLPTLQAGAQLQLVYRLRATMPITGSSEGFRAYAYYTPEVSAYQSPIQVAAQEP